MNKLPFSVDPATGALYYNNTDASGYLAMPVEQVVRDGSGDFVPITVTNPLQTADAAVLAELVLILAQLGTTGVKKIIDALPAGTNNIGLVTNAGSTMKGANVAVVTTAGTRVQLPTLACNKVTVIAKRFNTGYIYAGMNSVSSTVYGVQFAAMDSYDFDVSNLNEIWIDASVSGEGISYIVI